MTKEWKKLEELPAWLPETVKPKWQVQQEALKSGKSVHFGSLMDLLFEKHRQLALKDDEKVYKWRVVFRGDQVKDEGGFHACFSEQGSGSSHLAAAKFLGAIAHMPGCCGYNADAASAYTQVLLDDMDEAVQTWTFLPPHERPASWAKIDNPVCILRVNLYGHPLAGLWWEIHCEKQVLALGLKKMEGHECLFINEELKVFLSVYVDDFKFAGLQANIEPLIKKLRTKIKMGNPIPLERDVYPGCSQMPISVSRNMVIQKDKVFRSISTDQ